MCDVQGRITPTALKYMKLKANTLIFKVLTYREFIAHQYSYYKLIIMLSVIAINLIKQ